MLDQFLWGHSSRVCDISCLLLFCQDHDDVEQVISSRAQGSHRLEKYLNLKGFIEKSLKIKYVLKSTGKSLKSIEKYLNFTIFCRT